MGVQKEYFENFGVIFKLKIWYFEIQFGAISHEKLGGPQIFCFVSETSQFIQSISYFFIPNW